jgi:hypothetical protein
MKAKVQEYQTIYDIALQYCGSVDAAVAILLLNNKTSEAILAGEELLLPEANDAQILSWITANNVSIATAVTPNDYLPAPTPEPEPDPTCDPATVTLFSLPFLTVNSGGAQNIRVLREDLSPATIVSTNEGDIIIDFPDECATFEELLSTKDWATQIAPNLNDEQINDASVPYEVKYVNGTMIETDLQAPGSPLVVIVPNPLAPSGIAYFEPNDSAYPLPSFEDYDDGWREVNGVFRRTKPVYAIYCQKLNISSTEPRITLQFNNVHGTTDRYTREDGSTTPVTTDQVIVRDHLTGKEWIEWQITPNLWVDLLNEAYARGWFLPSQQEFISVRNNSSGTVDMLGRIMITSSQAQVFGTTNPANTTNYLGSNNLQVPYSSYDKSVARRTMLLVRNGTF